MQALIGLVYPFQQNCNLPKLLVTFRNYSLNFLTVAFSSYVNLLALPRRTLFPAASAFRFSYNHNCFVFCVQFSRYNLSLCSRLLLLAQHTIPNSAIFSDYKARFRSPCNRWQLSIINCQLSIAKPTALLWWAKMDSNHRPHDYQSCALAS